MIRMVDGARLLITGGSGLLGAALRARLPEALAPSHAEFDVCRPDAMEAYVAGRKITMVLHAAAFTSPPRIDAEPMRALETNIVGTANVAALCARHGFKLVYVSTDYVFRGDQGNYGEEDPVYPVNGYAWSKLGGECAARMLPDALILRTSFGPEEFPYPRAFADQWTSRERVSVIADKIVAVLGADVSGVLHLGGPRRTVLDYARASSPHLRIDALHTSEVDFAVPRDTSLNTERFERLIGKGE